MTHLENRLNALKAELSEAQSVIYHFEHRRDFNPNWPLSVEEDNRLEQLYIHVEDLTSTIDRLSKKG